MNQNKKISAMIDDCFLQYDPGSVNYDYIKRDDFDSRKRIINLYDKDKNQLLCVTNGNEIIQIKDKEFIVKSNRINCFTPDFLHIENVDGKLIYHMDNAYQRCQLNEEQIYLLEGFNNTSILYNADIKKKLVINNNHFNTIYPIENHGNYFGASLPIKVDSIKDNIEVIVNKETMAATGIYSDFEERFIPIISIKEYAQKVGKEIDCCTKSECLSWTINNCVVKDLKKINQIEYQMNKERLMRKKNKILNRIGNQ